MKRFVIYVTIIIIALCVIISGFTRSYSGCYDSSCPPTDTPFVPTDTESPTKTPVSSNTPEPSITPQPTATSTVVTTTTNTPSIPKSDPTPTDVPKTNKEPEPTSTPNKIMPDTGPFDEYLPWLGLALLCIALFTGAGFLRRRNG